jgi:hypothetical protein
MRRPGLRVLLAALLLSLSVTVSHAAPDPDRVWFCPGPGTIDFVRLFEHPEEWAHARQLVSVFKFYQQHTQTPAPSIVGPNTYAALARAGVFRTLKNWGKKTAIEVGAVKDFYCTPDPSGMNAAIAGTLESVQAIRAAGGEVSYLSMDDPFAAGRVPVCGGPALEPTADRLAIYVKAVRAALPAVQVGWIEAYPFSSAEAIENMMALLASRDALPSFIHMDVDLPFLVRTQRTDDFVRDIRRLGQAAAARNMRFGVIIWGNNGDADTLYALDAERFVESLTATYPTWEAMPDHIIVQSWAVSGTGLLITPTNLPEDRPYTHTHLLWSFFRRLKGQSGATTSGTAVNRAR